jgi:hypothetical protein
VKHENNATDDTCQRVGFATPSYPLSANEFGNPRVLSFELCSIRQSLARVKVEKCGEKKPKPSQTG